MPKLWKMRKLVADARDVGRDPVKITFTNRERSIARSFIESKKLSGTPRHDSLVRLPGLLGLRLDASLWHLLDNANKVGNLTFLVGGSALHPAIRKDRELTGWTNKCFGVAEVDPEVFVVGLNQIFYDQADAYWVNRVRP